MKNERQTTANNNPDLTEVNFSPILLNDEQMARLTIAYSAFTNSTRDLVFPIGETGLYSAARLHSQNGVSLLNELTKIGCIDVDSVITFPSGENLRMITQDNALLFFIARDYAIESEKKPTQPQFCELLEPYRQIEHNHLIKVAELELQKVYELERQRREQIQVSNDDTDPVTALLFKIVNERSRDFISRRNSKATSPIKSAIWPVSVSDFSKITGIDIGIANSYLSKNNTVISEDISEILLKIIGINKLDFSKSKLTYKQVAAFIVVRYREQLIGENSLIKLLDSISSSQNDVYEKIFENISKQIEK